MGRMTRLVVSLVLSFGCYTQAGTQPTVAVFDPSDPSETVVGRDCSFHLAGMSWRDLSVRRAARNALGEGSRRRLVHMTSRVVYPAPFKVCVEVEGIPADASTVATVAAR